MNEVKEESRVEMSALDILLESRPRIGSTTISTGKTVYFLSMSGEDHYKMVVHNQVEQKPMPDAEVVAMCVCDKDGNKLFKEVSQGIGLLQGRDGRDLRKIAIEILVHSRIPNSIEEKEAQEKKS